MMREITELRQIVDALEIEGMPDEGFKISLYGTEITLPISVVEQINNSIRRFEVDSIDDILQNYDFLSSLDPESEKLKNELSKYMQPAIDSCLEKYSIGKLLHMGAMYAMLKELIGNKDDGDKTAKTIFLNDIYLNPKPTDDLTYKNKEYSVFPLTVMDRRGNMIDGNFLEDISLIPVSETYKKKKKQAVDSFLKNTEGLTYDIMADVLQEIPQDKTPGATLFSRGPTLYITGIARHDGKLTEPRLPKDFDIISPKLLV